MAIHRKKRYETPVKCSICKKIRAFHTVHGHRRHGGHSCCNTCYPSIKAEWENERARENAYEMTEADYQTWGRL
jgi:hypothetical protein